MNPIEVIARLNRDGHTFKIKIGTDDYHRYEIWMDYQTCGPDSETWPEYSAYGFGDTLEEAVAMLMRTKESPDPHDPFQVSR